MKIFDKWLIKKYGKNFKQSINYFTCSVLTRKGWLGCKNEVLNLIKSSKINHENQDIKFLIEEIKKF